VALSASDIPQSVFWTAALVCLKPSLCVCMLEQNNRCAGVLEILCSVGSLKSGESHTSFLVEIRLELFIGRSDRTLGWRGHLVSTAPNGHTE
jgi:hypothetical protein